MTNSFVGTNNAELPVVKSLLLHYSAYLYGFLSISLVCYGQLAFNPRWAAFSNYFNRTGSVSPDLFSNTKTAIITVTLLLCLCLLSLVALLWSVRHGVHPRTGMFEQRVLLACIAVTSARAFFVLLQLALGLRVYASLFYSTSPYVFFLRFRWAADYLAFSLSTLILCSAMCLSTTSIKSNNMAFWSLVSAVIAMLLSFAHGFASSLYLTGSLAIVGAIALQVHLNGASKSEANRTVSPDA